MNTRIQKTSHTRKVVRECCKDDYQSQWRRANFNPPPPLNPLTDPHQNLRRWLRRGYLPPCKILFRSNKGFRFRACATPRTNVTRLFFLGSNNHLQPRRHHGHRRKIRQATRFCARMCLLGSQNHTLTSTPPFSEQSLRRSVTQWPILLSVIL